MTSSINYRFDMDRSCQSTILDRHPQLKMNNLSFWIILQSNRFLCRSFFFPPIPFSRQFWQWRRCFLNIDGSFTLICLTRNKTVSQGTAPARPYKVVAKYKNSFRVEPNKNNFVLLSIRPIYYFRKPPLWK